MAHTFALSGRGWFSLALLRVNSLMTSASIELTSEPVELLPASTVFHVTGSESTD